jgi:Hydantoinase/oxoprolinase N-terminal region
MARSDDTGARRRLSAMTSYRVGVDIGGSFTDIVLLGSDGTIHTKKVASSVDNYARAIVDGLVEVFAETGLEGAAIEEIRHGTTVASNAILEHKGARVGLVTSKGFRDVLEIRTLRMPRLYDLGWTKPPPLVERYLRQVVDERVDASGRVERALERSDAERAVDALLAENIEALAICLINSFANPAHELTIKEVARRKAPSLPLSVSCELLPEIKEYERTSTTVVNAYVMPIVAQYLAVLRMGLDAADVPAERGEETGRRRHDDAAHAERPRYPAGEERAVAAEGEQHELPRIAAALGRHRLDRPDHVRRGDLVRPVGRSVGAHAEWAGDPLPESVPRLFGIELNGAADEVPRVDVTKDEVGIGHRRNGAALIVADRPGRGAGAFRAHPQCPSGVDRDQRAATGADLGEVDRPYLQRVTGAGEEARADHHAGADRILGGTGDLAVLDDRHLRGGAAHVEGDDLRQLLGARQRLRANDAGRRSRFDDVHRPVGRRGVPGQPAIRLH